MNVVLELERSILGMDELKDVENHIVSGDLVYAKKVLQNLWKRKKVKSHHLAKYSELCNRTGLFDISINALTKKVFFEKSDDKNILKEIAIAKLFSGSRAEAIELITKIQDSEPSYYNFLMGFYHLHIWDFDISALYFESYIESKKITEYQRQIGRLNLANCYNNNKDYAKAYNLLGEILDYANLNKLNLIRGHCYQLAAQTCFHMKNFDEMKEYTKKAKEFLHPDSSDYISIDKLQAVKNIEHGQDIESNLQVLEVCSKRSQELGYVEMHRSCDFYLGLFKKDNQLMNYNYYGSPYPNYRKNISNLNWFKLQESFTYNEKGTKWIDMQTAQTSQGSNLGQKKLTFKLLKYLTSDFYKKFSINETFEYLFPSEVFIPVYSEKKLNSLKSRLNKELAHMDLDIKVTSRKSLMGWETKDTSIIIPLNDSPESD